MKVLISYSPILGISSLLVQVQDISCQNKILTLYHLLKIYFKILKLKFLLFYSFVFNWFLL